MRNSKWRFSAPAIIAAFVVGLLAGLAVRSQPSLTAVAGRSIAALAAPTTTTTTPPAPPETEATTETTAVPPTTAAPSTTDTTAPAPTTTTAATAAPAPSGPQIPHGKGMWIYQPQSTEAGDPGRIVTRAVQFGITHVFVRTGSSVDGLTIDFLDALLPVMHQYGIKVYGWDFPYLNDPVVDATRAAEAIGYVTPTGDRLDGFSADIETRYEGVALTSDAALAYGNILRTAVGPNYLLIATVPRPSPARQADYPYEAATMYFDAIAPMVYWVDVSPIDAGVEAVRFLVRFGKPVLPVGQAYDSGLEGGTSGTPTPDDLVAFVNAVGAEGAAGVSFWSWQAASEDLWSAIGAAPEVGVR